MNPTIFMMAGGTGGHIFPALAVAKALQNQGFKIIWLGTKKGLENEIIPAAQIKLEHVPFAPVRNKKIYHMTLLPFKLLKATMFVKKLIKNYKPQLVIGFGGYAAAPGGLAAFLARVPLIIHEQNSIPGLTNKMLMKIAQKVCVTYPGTLVSTKTILTGNPLRAEICQIKKNYEQNSEKPLRILVLGGSQGANALNVLLPEAIHLLKDSVEVMHQCGQKHFNSTAELYEKWQVSVDLRPFIADMPAAYHWADIVIARAGATTIAELACVGCPSILIPYPFAVDDHQTMNAKYLVNQKAAVIMPQLSASAELLAKEIENFAKNRPYLMTMAEQAWRLGKRDATETMVAVCLQAVGEKRSFNITAKP